MNKITGKSASEKMHGRPSGKLSEKDGARAGWFRRKNRESAGRTERKRKIKNGDVAEAELPIAYAPETTVRYGGRVYRYLGMLCRMAVLVFAVFGMGLFLCDAFGIGSVGGLFLFFTSLAAVLAWSLAVLVPWGAVAPPFLCGGGVLYVFLVYGDGIAFMGRAFVTLYNAVLTRLSEARYYAMMLRIVPLEPSEIADESYLRAAVAVVLFLIAAVDVIFMMRKSRVIVPGIFNALLVAVIFTYNITRSNWGVAVLLAAFAALLIMAIYEKIYDMRAGRRQYDKGTVLLADGIIDSPEKDVPGEVPQAKKHVGRHRAADGMTVGEELDWYTSAPASRKRHRERPTDENRAMRREERRAKRAARRAAYRRRDERLASGGITALSVFLVCLMIASIPAASVKENFRTFTLIDKQMTFYRDFVTALLQGNDPILDDMSYAANAENFKPHSADATPRRFTGETVMEIEANASAALYLRGWTGVSYYDGAWHVADDDVFGEYRRLFGTQIDPSEYMLFGFYRYMEPGVIEDATDYDYETGGKFISRLSDGFVVEQVNIRRISDTGSLCFFPSYYNRSAGLRRYGSAEPSPLTYINYYDGTYTGHLIKKDASYAVVAFVPTMKSENWYKNVSQRIAAYEYAKQKIEEAVERGYQFMEDNEDGRTEEWYEETVVVTYTDADGRTWRDTYDKETRELLRRELTNDPTEKMRNLYTAYFYQMTDEEKEQLLYQFRVDNYYTDFVYDTYLQVDESECLDRVFKEIYEGRYLPEMLAGLQVGTDETADETVGGTADIHPAERASSDAATYEQRHKLVMSIVDYLGETCTYTLTPTAETDPSLDGVENFLTYSKEGYCVQYASALTLLLRRAGIPARYVEGYVASDLARSYDNSAVSRYSGTVRDYNAHAWVEVWYDGLGWIPYEATPAYYSQLYYVEPGKNQPGYVRPSTPGDGDDTEEDPMTDEEREALLREQELAEKRARIRRIVLAVSMTALVLAAVLVTLRLLTRRMKEHRDRRLSLAKRLMESGGETQERRADATAVIDMLTELLALYGTSPEVGETREEYVERLIRTYEADPMQGEEKPAVGRHKRRGKKYPKAGAVSANDMPAAETAVPEAVSLMWRRVFDAIAAEEFGGQMTAEELCLCAGLYKKLYEMAPMRLGRLRRLRLSLFEAKL